MVRARVTLALLAVATPAAARAQQPLRFEREVLDDRVGIGYGVALADVDGDGRRDVVLVDRDAVRWHRAPAFERRVLCGRQSELDHVCIAARDVAGDAKAEIALGAGWNPADTTTPAPALLLRSGESPLEPWTSVQVAGEPTLHRMRWAKNRRGEGRLLILPLHGRGNSGAQGEGVRLLEVHPDAVPPRVDEHRTPLHQAHNLDVVEWDGDADEELLVAAREGLFLFDRRHRDDSGGPRWTTTELVGPASGHPGFAGASEVRLGRLANGRRFLAAIEPFHGSTLVVYGEPKVDGEPWSRHVLDDSMSEGHALACADLLRGGEDAIVVGWRRPGADGKTGLRIHVPAGEPWSFARFELDDRVACEDLAVGDLDEDGRPDVVAAGRDSHDLVLFRNRSELATSGEPSSRRPRAPIAPLVIDRLDAIDEVVAQAIAEGQTPGAVVAIGRSDGLVFLRAYGERAIVPERAPMRTDALFDLASLTKPLVTATALAILADEGRLALDDPIAKHLPHTASTATIRDALLHTAGFVPDNDLDDYAQGVDEAWRRLLAQRGTKDDDAPASARTFRYSDVGYLLLGRVVERVSGQPLEAFARERIFAPLRMHDAGYRPGAARRARAVPTEPRDGAMLQGVVHDPRAALLGGVAGHAGVFATAEDLARYARMLLNEGELEGVRVLSADAVARLTTAEPVGGGALRTPGFDAASRFSSQRGELFTARAFGHGGFTGTSLWIDPALDLFVIVLGSRLHPDGQGLVNPAIGRIATIAAAAVGRAAARRDDEGGERNGGASTVRSTGSATDSPPAAVVRRDARAAVRVGIDVLRDESFARLRGRRVGLVTNRTGRASDGTPTIELLASAPARAAGVELRAIFTPEHGLDALADSPIADSGELVHGAPVFSLYGERRKPSAQQLAGLDTLLFDVQDAGARCYTYVATLALCMEAAAEHGLRFVVLDRPNPIGGERVGGPLPDPGRESFTAPHPIALRHGMTVGELARMFRSERIPPLVGAERAARFELDVVALEGWRRADLFDATGLAWVNPSPNLRSLDAALLYPGLVLFEFTNLSVGRGTERPFLQVGAPWLDPQAVMDELERIAASGDGPDFPDPRLGLALAPVELTPDSSTFAGRSCRGLRFEIADRRALDPLRFALALACALRRTHPGAWELERFDALLCSKATMDALREAVAPAEIWRTWERDAAAFRARRAPFLLYE